MRVEMRVVAWLLLVSRVPAPEVDEVVVRRSVFEKRLRGHNFTRWSDFVSSAGGQGGETRLEAGMALALAVIATVALAAFIAYLVSLRDEIGKKQTQWLVFAIIVLYALAVYAYCSSACQDPKQRIVTNILFGLVPFAISIASYLAVFIVFDSLDRLDRLGEHMADTQGNQQLRAALVLAVLPSLAICLRIMATTSTGFQGGGTFFDVLSFCLYSDLLRLVLHLAFVLAPGWTLDSSGTGMLSVAGSDSQTSRGNALPSPSIKRMPGAVYVVAVLCLVWYASLARLAAGAAPVPFHITPSLSRIFVLACVNSYVFFPVAVVLAWDLSERVSAEISGAVAWNFLMWLLAAWMMLVAMFFNAEGPNIVGIGCMLFLVFYNSRQCSQGLLGFILALVVCAAVTFFAVYLSMHFAESLRAGLYAALK